MSEIYWITVLGNLSNLFVVTCVCFGLVTAGIAVSMWIEAYEEEDRKPFYKWIKCCGIAFIVTSLMAIFTPSKQDLYAIYGIGGVIDYVQSNETAKQLPDKTIKALDKWLDEINKENNDADMKEDAR